MSQGSLFAAGAGVSLLVVAGVFIYAMMLFNSRNKDNRSRPPGPSASAAS